MKHIIRFIFSLLFLPIVLFIETIKSQKSVLKKIGWIITIIIFFGITWFVGYRNLINFTKTLFYSAGILDKITNVKVSGKSMLPTIQDGQVLDLHNPKKYKVERGDIVSFNNIETGSFNYIKRVIGLEGEKIAIEDGVVKINDTPLEENYIYNNSLTYGNTYILDCEAYEIPKGKLAVFGDNRIA